jgi:uncharacterized membrane protein YfcA
MDPLIIVSLGVAAFISGIIGGLVGLGSGIIMIAVLTFAFGIRDAVPIVTLSLLVQAWPRVWTNRSLIDFGVVKWFSLGALPAAVLGSIAFANLPAALLKTALAIFLMLMVLYRRTPFGRDMPVSLRRFCLVGLGQGFLSALFGGAGAFGAPFFLSYGLRRGAFVGTMASGLILNSLVKVTVYGTYKLFDGQGLVIGLSLGAIMVGGGYLGGMLVQRVSDKSFVYIVETVMVVAAVSLLLH